MVDERGRSIIGLCAAIHRIDQEMREGHDPKMAIKYAVALAEIEWAAEELRDSE